MNEPQEQPAMEKPENNQSQPQKWTPEQLAQWTPEELEKGQRFMNRLAQARDLGLAKQRTSSSQAKADPSQPATQSAS
jgi:hypothetical protein